MILQRLNELYDRLKDDDRYRIPPVGYSTQRIGFRVVMAGDGQFRSVQDIRIAAGGKLRARELIVPGGDKPPGAVTRKSVGTKVHILRNDLPFLLGLRIDEDSGEPQLLPCHMEFETFRDRHLAIERDVDDEAFSAVCRFLERWDPDEATELEGLEEFGKLQGVFQLQGEAEYVHEREAVSRWWENHWRDWTGVEESPSVPCLVTGRDAPPARTHPKIKGIRGGNTTGCSIVGFNEPAFESYGRRQSFNAPVSGEVAFRYVTALNALTAGPHGRRHSLRVGNQDAPLTVAFWTEEPTPFEDVFAAVLSFGSEAARIGEKTEGKGSPEGEEAQDEGILTRIETFLEALRVGTEQCGDLGEDPEKTRFHILGLAPNAARIAVRFFLTANLSELLENLRTHHRDIGIVRRLPSARSRGDPEFPPTWLLLDQTCPRVGGKPDRKAIPPVLAGPLLTAILTGSRYPDGLYSAVMRRIHADHVVNYPRACVVKGHLNRNLSKEVTMGLNPQRQDPAYRIGRLFAALEKTQKDALGENLNATIRNRYFGAASATPGSVIPRLLRTYQHHLSKLEGGRRVVRERLVQEILGPLDGFPAHLNLTDQGLFALGYYHQTHDFYTPKGDTKPQA